MGFFRRKGRTADSGAAHVVEVEPVEAYLGVRGRVLALAREQRGDAAMEGRVLALVMETRYPSSVSAIVSLGDGTTGLYFHDGRSLLRAEEDQGVVAAAQAWLQRCDESLTNLAAVAGEPPLPELRTTSFLAVTSVGDFAGSIPHAERDGNPLLGLWTGGEAVRKEVLRWMLKGKAEIFAP